MKDSFDKLFGEVEFASDSETKQDTKSAKISKTLRRKDVQSKIVRKPLTEKHRQIMRETAQKNFAGSAGANKGKAMSQEQKQKLRKHWDDKKVTVHTDYGVFNGITEAAQQLNLTEDIVRGRCRNSKSARYKNWYRIDKNGKQIDKKNITKLKRKKWLWYVPGGVFKSSKEAAIFLNDSVDKIIWRCVHGKGKQWQDYYRIDATDKLLDKQ